MLERVRKQQASREAPVRRLFSVLRQLEFIIITTVRVSARSHQGGENWNTLGAFFPPKTPTGP